MQTKIIVRLRPAGGGDAHPRRIKSFESRHDKKVGMAFAIPIFLKCIDNNDTVSNSFIWFHSKNETIKREVKLSF